MWPSFVSLIPVYLIIFDQTFPTVACPDVCRCVRVRKTVHCIGKGLSRIPYSIPQWTESLYLQDNLLSGGTSLEMALMSLTNLKELHLSRNKLTSFPQKLPRSLIQVFIDSNNIKFVGRGSIQGLSKLKTLSLQNNNISSERGLSSAAFTGADNLKTLTLSGNALNAIPQGLPSGLEKLLLDNNNISGVSYRSLEKLIALKFLIIGHNRITNEKIESMALSNLRSLTELDMSYNLLTNVPAYLPRFIKVLQLSHNQIKYLYSSSSAYYSKITGLPLTHLDISSNKLQSVEPNSLSGVNPFIQLHDNPWSCDCYLRYLKSWLNNTSAVFTGEGRTKCALPVTLEGVTLSSLDLEALICPATNYRNAVQFGNIHMDSITVRWRPIARKSPMFVSTSLVYGELLCQNCSLPSMYRLDDNVEYAKDWIKDDYRVIDLNTAHKNTANMTYTLRDLSEGTRYVICITDSTQNALKVTVEQCHVILTKLNPPPPKENVIAIPSLSIILIVVVSALLVLITIVVVLIIRHYIKTRNEKRILKTRANATPFPAEYIDQMLQRNNTQQHPRMGLTAPHRNLSYNGQQPPPRLAQTVDTRKEFDVTLVYNGRAHFNTNNNANTIDFNNTSNEGSSLLTDRTDVGGSSAAHNERLLNEEMEQYHQNFQDNRMRQNENTVPMTTYLEKASSVNSSPHSRDTGVFV